MSASIDLFDNPKAVLAPDFNPFSCSLLGIKLGSAASELDGWEAETDEFGFHHLNGGIGFGVRDDIVASIKLPVSFVERIEIASIDEMIQAFGKNDDTREISYRDRLRHCGYLWNRGLIFWWEILPEVKPGHLIVFNPTHGYPHIGRDVSFKLVAAKDCLDRKPFFEIPASEARENLRPGDLAKLVFDIKIGSKSFVERMWVNVTEVKSEIYLGQLANDPYCTYEIKCGMNLQFHADNIIQIQLGKR